MMLYVWFLLMIVLSLVWVAVFLWRPLKIHHLNLERSNIALGKQKQAELQIDLAQNLIDKKTFDDAQNDIIQTLASELEKSPSNPVWHKTETPFYGIVLIAVLICVMSLGLYQILSPKTPPLAIDKAIMPLSLEQSVAKLKTHLIQSPDDVKAWQMLGLSYFELNQLDRALEAYEEAYQLSPKNPRLLVEYASTMVIKNNHIFQNRAIELIKQALEIDPNSPDALYLAGLFAANQQDFKLAKKLWEKSLSLLPENNPDATVLMQALQKLSEQAKQETQAAHFVVVKVTLSEKILANRSKNDFVMVYIKAAQGLPMPIAIQKIPLKDFTGTVRLTNEDSILSGRKLSDAAQVIAVVRLSKSGTAIRQSGDVQVLSQIINVGDNPTVHLQVE